MDTPSPFGGFGLPQSLELINQQRETLVAKVKRIATVHPDARRAGLILECAAPEALDFRRGLGLPDELAGFVGVVPRMMALDLLGHDRAAGLDLVDDQAGGPWRKLPILLIATMGFRVGAGEYGVEDVTG